MRDVIVVSMTPSPSAMRTESKARFFFPADVVNLQASCRTTKGKCKVSDIPRLPRVQWLRIGKHVARALHNGMWLASPGLAGPDVHNQARVERALFSHAGGQSVPLATRVLAIQGLSANFAPCGPNRTKGGFLSV